MRASQVDTPHFHFPFSLASDGKSVSVEEQDTPEEIRGCVELILRTPQGHRSELPAFGIADLTFRQVTAEGLDVSDVVEAVETWEPRADALLSDAPELLDETTRNVAVTTRGT